MTTKNTSKTAEKNGAKVHVDENSARITALEKKLDLLVDTIINQQKSTTAEKTKPTKKEKPAVKASDAHELELTLDNVTSGGKGLYKNKIDGTPIKSLYLEPGAFGNDWPDTITVTVSK